MMLGMIIWILVIVVVINYNRNKKKNPGSTLKRERNLSVPNHLPQRQAVPPSAPNSLPQRQAVPNRPAGSSAEKAGQEELKRRLQQQYGRPSIPQHAKKQETVKAKPIGSDILARATANVEEDFGTDTYLKEVEHVCTRPVGMADDCDLMRKVQDLIVMGYQGNMQFSRDFIGEAEDMLNRFFIGG